MSGSVAQAMDAAELKVEEQYTVQYIAHAPLEPRAAVAEWDGDKADRVDGNAAAIRRARRTGAGLSTFADAMCA